MEDYLNPTPSAGKRNSAALSMKQKAQEEMAKHGKSMGAHLDDMGDIYDHTKVAF